MSGLAPQVSVMGLALGLVFALGCYLVTNLSPGGMITPGWLALVLIADPPFALIIAGVAVVTYFVSRGLQRVVILYGKRLFATVVLVGVFLQVTIFVFATATAEEASRGDYTTLGFIVPGLVAYQLIRQPMVATLTATAAVAAMAYVVILTGVELHLIRGEGGTTSEGLSGTPDVDASAPVLIFVGLSLAAGLWALVRSLRRVPRTPPAHPGPPRAAQS